MRESSGLLKIFSVVSNSMSSPARSSPINKNAQSSEIRAACCMLWVTMTTVTRSFKRLHQFFDVQRRDGVERGGGLVHQQHFGVER